jgi:glutathione synthase/RimK-type ligase-like ATP-grasp enzyme
MAVLKNAERLIVQSVRRYAASRGFEMSLHGDGWIVEIKLGRHSHFVHGYDLGLNTASSQRVANDKAATFEILSAAGIPAVPHRLFMHPRFLGFMTVEGNWQAMLAAFDQFGRDVVVKDNEGTGGMEMARARSVSELEHCAQRLFNTTRGLALSPFLELDEELRFVLLDGDCVIAYRKERSAVTGDGAQTIAALVAGAIASGQLDHRSVELAMPDGRRVPRLGERVAVAWRHNLGQGAKAVRMDVGGHESVTARDLAIRACQRLGLRFASIDIVSSGGRQLVLEANAGVMLEVMARGAAGGDTLADAIYHRALDLAIAAGRCR